MTEDRPAWARRMTNEREARGWSQAEAVRALKAHATSDEKIHADDASLLRQWKRWEAGEIKPGDFYQPIIARAFGTVTHAIFPVPPRRDTDADVLAVTGMDTLELVSRLQRSDLDDASLSGLRVMADSLCTEYPFLPPDQLLTEGRAWLRRITQLQGQRLTLKQHREILVLAGWVALLLACVEYDTGNRQAADTTRPPWRRRPAGNPGSESVGSDRGQAADRGGARPGTAAARSHALPRKPGPPFRGGPDQVRLLRHGLLPATGRGQDGRDLGR